MFRKYTLGTLVGILGIALVISCSEEEPNPFDPFNNPPVDTTLLDNVDPNSILGLHKNIFEPHCANPGCHDGANEPDFRTMEGAYNTLVYHPVVQNDSFGTFTYRVVPGDLAKSILYTRLTQSVNGLSEVMPLEVPTGSEWLQNKDQYLLNIQTWIENGAPNVFGNQAQLPNKEPYSRGLVAFNQGTTTTPFERWANGTIKIPQGTGSVIDLWFSIGDDSTAVNQLLLSKVKFSDSRDIFDNATEFNLEYMAQPIQAEGLFTESEQFNFKLSLDLNAIGTFYDLKYIRLYLKDAQNDTTEIPEYHTANNIKTYFSLERL